MQANRVKNARLQLGYTREKFAEEHGISVSSLRSWETGKYQLSSKAVLRLVSAFEASGLVCTTEWLLNGEGLAPRLAPNAKRDLIWDEEETILKEVFFFEENNSDPVVLVVPDDAMEPVYSVGDYVAGNAVSLDLLSDLNYKNCIFKLNSGETVVRRLNRTKGGVHNLYPLNMNTNLSTAFFKDVQVEAVAQVVWHRKLMVSK